MTHILARLHVQKQRGIFKGPAFFQPIRAFRKLFKLIRLASSYMGISRPSKKRPLLRTCKQANHVVGTA